MPNSTGKEIARIKKIIEEAETEIKKQQDACEHDWQETYCGINDWEFTCTICGKKKYEEA